MLRERMMIIELMNILVSDTRGEQLSDALESLAGSIQVQPGCLGCRLSKSWPTHDTLQIEARWETQQDLIRHLRSHLYKRVLLLMELSAAPPVVEFFSVLEMRGLDLVEAARSSPD